MSLSFLPSDPLRSPWVRLVIGILSAVLAATTVCGIWLYGILHPPRHTSGSDPASFLISYEEVSFHSVDGVSLAGWFVPGKSGAPTLILCHDRGEDRSAMVNTAVPLRKAGYNLFLLDFRGHGRSGGSCTLGVAEKRDILGALDYLITRSDLDRNRFGLLGVRMGAHAGILAARDRKELRALVLDSPYNEVRSFLSSELSKNETLQKYVTPLPLLLFDLHLRAFASHESAGKALPELADRDLLFIFASDDPNAASVRAMYNSVPEVREADKNMLELHGSRAGPLYAADKERYDETVMQFFTDYLPVERSPLRHPLVPPGSQPASAQRGSVGKPSRIH